MFESQTKIRVRYAETDQMGYVYYGNYAAYYEVGRVEMLRQLSFSYREMEQSGVMMPVAHLSTNYLLPAKYDELLTVKVKISDFPTAAKMVFGYEIINEEAQLINTGETTLVFVDMKSNRPCRIPEKLAELLRPYFL